jgi:hypothetical protein
MNFGLIKNINRHNKRHDINNDLRDVPCQKKDIHAIILTTICLFYRAIIFEIEMLPEQG